MRRAVHGILLLDKPLGLSSNEALQQVKRLFRAEKAGHTGSLDPLATGMLPICFGQATKLCGQLLESDKRYLAQVRLGEKTATGDAEGEVIARSDPAQLQPSELEAAMGRFIGEIQQTPPMYSALKHQGQRLYELAREGIEVERAARRVRVLDLRLTRCKLPEFEMDVRCSKGTYVRTLAEDLAAAVGQCAHLRGLRRLEAGPFAAQPMHQMEDLKATSAGGAEALDSLLLDTGAALVGWPEVRVDDVRAQRLRQGCSQQVPGVARELNLVVRDAGGRVLCLAESDGAGVIAPKRWLAP